MQDYMPDAKPVGKLNRRVLPEFVMVTDEPTLTNMGQSVDPSMYYRVAVVTPDILVEEMQLKARSGCEPRMVGMRLTSRPIACIVVSRPFSSAAYPCLRRGRSCRLLKSSRFISLSVPSVPPRVRCERMVLRPQPRRSREA